MSRQGWCGLMAAALCAALAGCGGSGGSRVSAGSDGQGDSVPELMAEARPPIPDLPVPVGFKLNEGQSRNFAAAGARYADHVYHGPADKFSVARFYKRVMPINRWTLVTEMFVQGDIMLDFEKATERCRVTLTSGGLFTATDVKVALWTSGRIIPPTQGPVPTKRMSRQ